MADANKRKEAFGDRLRDARLERGWSQERLAEELNRLLSAGDEHVSQRSLSQWELGRHVPRREKLPAIESLLRIKRGTLSAILEDVPVPPSDEEPDAATIILRRLDALEAAFLDLAAEVRLHGREVG